MQSQQGSIQKPNNHRTQTMRGTPGISQVMAWEGGGGGGGGGWGVKPPGNSAERRAEIIITPWNDEHILKTWKLKSPPKFWTNLLLPVVNSVSTKFLYIFFFLSDLFIPQKTLCFKWIWEEEYIFLFAGASSKVMCFSQNILCQEKQRCKPY